MTLQALSREGWLAAAALALVCSAASAQDNKVVPVEAAKVIAAPLSEQVTAIGTLLSNEAVAEAKLKLAEQTHQRRTALLSNKYATAQSADESASNLAVSTAAVELARAQLEKAHIVAPFAGIVGLRHVSVGEYITSGQALVNLEAIDPVKADFRVPEKFLPAIRVGQTIRIKVDAFPDATFEGKVYAIDPRLDVSGRSLLVRALVPNKDQWLRPGLFARVTVLLQLKEEALSVPEQAIVPQGDSQYVVKIVGGKVQFTKVVTGTRREGRVEIVEGLTVGDQVVTAGQLKIRDGTAVSIANGTGA